MNLSSSEAVPSLSTKDLFARVQACAPRIAVFDCDGTLWSGDAGSHFMRWSMETGLLSAPAAGWLKTRYAGYKRGEVSELAICGEMVQVYQGIPIDTLRAAATAFFTEHVAPLIFPAMERLVAELRDAGVEIWAVSSTCDWVIEEGVRRFGIPRERVLAACTRPNTDGPIAVASDQLIAVPTDQGKVDALRGAGVKSPDAVFGNSVHDAAMLELARMAFPINPTAELAKLSAERGWPVHYPGLTE